MWHTLCTLATTLHINKKPSRQILTTLEFRNIRDELKEISLRDSLIIQLIRSTARSLNDILALEISDADFVKSTIYFKEEEKTVNVTTSHMKLLKSYLEATSSGRVNDTIFITRVELTSWIVSELFGKDHLEEVLQEYANEKTPLILPEKLTTFLSSIIKRYAPITLKMNNFFETLRKKTKQAPYPADELDQLWTEAATR